MSFETKKARFERNISCYLDCVEDLKNRKDLLYPDCFTLELLKERVEGYENTCFMLAIEYLEEKPEKTEPGLVQLDFFGDPLVVKPGRKKIQELIDESIYSFVTHKTAETRFLAKAKFFCDAWIKPTLKDQKFWLMPDGGQTLRPERAWKAWLRDYELKQKIQNEN